MAEDDLVNPQDPSTTGLSADDIKPKIYEGGFKTWECSVDLARYLARLIEEEKLTFEGKDVHVIEVLGPSSLLCYLQSFPCLRETDISTPSSELGVEMSVSRKQG